MTIERTLKKLYRKNTPIIVCEHSLEQLALGLRDTIDIMHKRKWFYGIKPPMVYYNHYIFSLSPKQEEIVYGRLSRKTTTPI